MLQALARELQEEIGIRVTQSRPWVTYVHVYPHTTVRLAFCHVTGWEGEPRGLENQRLEWVDPARAAEVGDLPPATLPPLRAGCSCRPATASVPSARARACRLSWAGWTRRWRVA